MAGPYRDLAPLKWLWLPLIPVSVLAAAGFFYRPAYNALTYKEGPVEWLTFVVALTGAVVAFVAHRRRRVIPHKWLQWLPLVFIAGFIFMAGEESSWGQHVLNPRLPGQAEETKNQGLANIDPRDPKAVTGEEREKVLHELNWLKRINDQGETNLHNLPGWTGDIFGKWPKQLIEFGSLIACVIVPMFFVRKLRLDDPFTTAYWFWPTHVCTVAAIIAFLLPWPKRIVEMFVDTADTALRLSETQELYLGIVLLLYISSLAVRLGQHQRATGLAASESAGQAPVSP